MEEIVYIKYSNDRAKEFQIRTIITKDDAGSFHVRKEADNKSAKEHIRNMQHCYEQLLPLLDESVFELNQCKMQEEGVLLEYLVGKTMEELLDDLLEDKKYESAIAIIEKVVGEIRKLKGQKSFDLTEQFLSVFGQNECLTQDEMDELCKLDATPISDIDMIMGNILVVEGQGKWHLLDYEWTFAFPIPLNFVIYRSLHYYINTTAKRRVLEGYDLFIKYGISQDEIAIYEKMEKSFQKYVLHGRRPLRILNEQIGNYIYDIPHMFRMEEGNAFQIYYDRGAGFSEEESEKILMKKFTDDSIELKLKLDETVKGLRIDPGNRPCIVGIEEINWEDSSEKITWNTTGQKLVKNVYVFNDNDPQFVLKKVPTGKKILHIRMNVAPVEHPISDKLMKKRGL